MKSGNVNYRMLYFFHDGRLVVITHGLVKKTQEVPPNEIERAAERKIEFEKDLESHTFPWEA